MKSRARIDALNSSLEGRYHIERELGEGGMANVYLARDEKHRRDVALKVLKPDLAAVVGVERFLAEIETTAKLQHPHILPLHDSGEADGLLFYVMPYVEGESLRDRLDREHQLPVDEAVRIAADLAEALDYAHRKGVIHRDIKPANVMLLQGRAVITDFGIARAVRLGGTNRLTETGLALGTPHYMSPEQATGDLDVGPAADIYGLGCVLYEMLMGEPPFSGSSPQAILGRIITTSPTPITELRKTVPPNVEAAVRKALEKVPADRFATASELGAALHDAAFRHGAVQTSESTAGASRWRRATIGAGTLAVALACTTAWALTRSPPPAAVQRFPLALAPDARSLGLLPDGSGAVFSTEGQLQLRRWASAATTPIAGATGVAFAHTSSVSPSGEEVAFVADGALRVAPLSGGTVRELARPVYCCARWAKDGFIYYSDGLREVWRVPGSGGEPEEVLARDWNREAALLHYAPYPDKDVALYTVMPYGDMVVEARRLSTGERAELAPGVRPRLTASGHIVFASVDGQLLAAGFDADALELTSPPVPLVDDVLVINDLAAYDLTESGSLIYNTGSPGPGSHEFVWLTREGDAVPVDSGESFVPNTPGGQILGWSVSPEGDRLAFQRIVDGNVDIWLKELPDGPVSRLTYHEAEDAMPSWTPDGSSVTFISQRKPDGGVRDDFLMSLWSRRADGTGEPRLLVRQEDLGGSGIWQHSWSPDGSSVVMRTTGAVRGLMVGRVGPDGVAIDSLLVTPFTELAPAISPDGRWLAYESDESGRPDIYVRPFPEVGTRRWTVGAGNTPIWSRDGPELYFVDFEGRELRAARYSVSDSDFRVESIGTLFRIPPEILIQSRGQGRMLDVAGDGRFLMLREVPASAAPGNIVLVRNWLSELDSRVGR